jgi:hypothetical protein
MQKGAVSKVLFYPQVFSLRINFLVFSQAKFAMANCSYDYFKRKLAFETAPFWLQ